ncbi:hypothetical protein NKR23_g10276 [Pleurostoma richardsiae]|uniref:Uncharacterized protein n=1 Tax=Pleurostoma richardsiae TaxID=41990 RepID=A0AA38RAS2_9PEZI|nr:hypothetical protein NKR23_g10276 [Pleurostoma richardsiae]
MGGFVLHPSDFVPFPLTVSQLHYLVTHGYVDFGDVLLTKSEIEDKNKFDTLARIITVLQLFWFVINVLARAALGMAITTLELSTAAFIFCTLFTYFCWRHKPQDVSEPVIIKPNVKLAEILVQAGPAAARPYSHTPLDFAKRKAHVFEYMWRYTFNVVKFVNIHFHPVERPITKIWDDQFFDLPPLANALLALVQLGFAAIHLLAWNFHFPSSVERLLWRIFSIYITCSVVCTWAALYWAFEAWPRIVGWLEDRQTTKRSLLSRMYSWWRSSMPCRLLGRISEAFRKGSFNRNLDQTVPLFAAVTIPLGGLYCCARTYIIVEDVINLRSLPTSTYDSVDWNAFLPHF